jgi:hypothetical protein
LWGGSLSGKEFVERRARKRHALQATTIDNHCVSYEIGGEEFKHGDFESSNVDNFYNLYHSELTLKDKREKLQS